MFKDAFLPDAARLSIRLWTFLIGLGLTYLGYFAAAQLFPRWNVSFEPRQIENQIWLLRVIGPLCVAQAVWYAIPLVKAFFKGEAISGKRVRVATDRGRVRALVVDRQHGIWKCRFADGHEDWVPNEQLDRA
jgi:hypothetical protein